MNRISVIAITLVIGFLAGRSTVKEPTPPVQGPSFYLKDTIHFDDGACHETTGLVDGQVQSKSWSANDSTGKLYFASGGVLEKHGCEEFYNLFGKKP